MNKIRPIVFLCIGILIIISPAFGQQENLLNKRKRLSINFTSKYHFGYTNGIGLKSVGKGFSTIVYNTKAQFGNGLELQYSVSNKFNILFSAEFRNANYNIKILTPKFVDQTSFFDPYIYDIHQPTIDYSIGIYYKIGKRHGITAKFINPHPLTDSYDGQPGQVSLLIDLWLDPSTEILEGGAIAIQKSISYPKGGTNFNSPELGYHFTIRDRLSLNMSVRYKWWANSKLFRWNSQGNVPQFPSVENQTLDEFIIENKFISLAIGLSYKIMGFNINRK